MAVCEAVCVAFVTGVVMEACFYFQQTQGSKTPSGSDGGLSLKEELGSNSLFKNDQFFDSLREETHR